jgi:dethiobiotin synthetase
MSSPPPTPVGRVLVLGTGTGVGKTSFAAALVRDAVARGADAVGLKPIETGPDHELDSAALSAAGPVATPALYRFQDPVSPHLAARRAGREIDLEHIGPWLAAHSRPFTVVEGAGGVFSPLSASRTNFDLVEQVAPDSLVLVCAGRLGTLHDVGATLRASRALPWSLLVVSGVEGRAAAEAQAAELREVVLPQCERTLPVEVFVAGDPALPLLPLTTTSAR